MFAALFFYAVNKLAMKYQTRERLVTPSAVASVIAFLAMTVYDLTAPPGHQWLLAYAVVGLPFLILILFLPL
jgi:uncharacterized membrane protein